MCIRDRSYGYVSPLLHPEQPGGNGEMMVPHMYWSEKEDCQNLNIWTPSIRDGRKRPVMVWLHGGGFSAGSSIEQLAYDGENLSRAGDVVVVSVNHRLNVLGYLDLSPFGEKYQDSANAGNLDLIAALEWICLLYTSLAEARKKEVWQDCPWVLYRRPVQYVNTRSCSARLAFSPAF